MGILDKIFRSKKTGTTPTDNVLPGTLDDFIKHPADERILILMGLGDREQADIRHFPFFQLSILSDPDKDVAFTALKRIHAFKDHPDTLPMMSKLMTESRSRDLEPYFSMALSRLGLISLDEFQKKINSSG